jgi:hypothetical protein
MTLGLLLLTILLVKNILTFGLTVPKCENCKSFVPGNKNLPDSGFCKIFVNKITFNNKQQLIYNYAKHCRDNEFLCGQSAWLFEDSKESNSLKSNPDEYVNFVSKKQIDKIEKNTLDYKMLSENVIPTLKINKVNNEYTENFNYDEKKYYNYYMNNLTKHNKIKKNIVK